MVATVHISACYKRDLCMYACMYPPEGTTMADMALNSFVLLKNFNATDAAFTLRCAPWWLTGAGGEEVH